MAVTIASLETHMESARAYIVAGSYTLAIQQATAGLAVLGFLSNDTAGGAGVDWNPTRTALESMIASAEALRATVARDALTGAGVRRTNIKWKRTS